MTYPVSFLFAFVLTILLEFFPFMFFLRGCFKTRFLYLVLINAVTLPLLWVFMPFFYRFYPVSLLFGEILVVVAEAVLIVFLLEKNWGKAFKASILMNALSALVGFVFF